MQKADCALSNVLIRARCPYKTTTLLKLSSQNLDLLMLNLHCSPALLLVIRSVKAPQPKAAAPKRKQKKRVAPKEEEPEAPDGEAEEPAEVEAPPAAPKRRRGGKK